MMNNPQKRVDQHYDNPYDDDQQYDNFGEESYYYSPSDILQNPAAKPSAPQLSRESSVVDLIQDDLYKSSPIQWSRVFLSNGINFALGVVFTMFNLVLHLLYYPILLPVFSWLFSGTWVANKVMGVIKPFLSKTLGVPTTVINYAFKFGGVLIWVVLRGFSWLLSFITPIANRYSYIKFTPRSTSHQYQSQSQRNQPQQLQDPQQGDQQPTRQQDQPTRQQDQPTPQQDQQHPSISESASTAFKALQDQLPALGTVADTIKLFSNPTNISRLKHIFSNPPHHNNNNQNRGANTNNHPNKSNNLGEQHPSHTKQRIHVNNNHNEPKSKVAHDSAEFLNMDEHKI